MGDNKGLIGRGIAIGMMVAIFLAAGCSPAKKPEAPPQKVIVVPESTRLGYDEIDQGRAPDIVRAMLRERPQGQSSLWATDGKYVYIALLRGDEGGARLQEVTEQYGGVNNSWLKVSLTGNNGQDKQGSQVYLVRALPRQIPRGVIYSQAAEKTVTPAKPPNSATPPAAPPASPARPSGQADTSANVIETPRPNAEITSPVDVAGKIFNAGENYKLRIMTASGIVLKEEDIKFINRTLGTFKNNVSYSPPPLPRPGWIEIINSSGASDITLAKVPVVIK